VGLAFLGAGHNKGKGLIRKLHTEQSLLGGDLRLEQILSEANLLIKKRQEYQETVGTLKTRLKRMAMNQEELMATVQHLEDKTDTNQCKRPTSVEPMGR
jgi:hypothetical protein